MDDNKPTFIIDWSVWDDTIGHHYELKSKDQKELMYALTINKQRDDVCIGMITPELQKTLSSVFSSRGAFSFLLENTVGIETSQPLPSVLPFKVDDGTDHRASIISLTFWETIKDSKNVFLVTEDADLMETMKDFSEQNGVKCNVINSGQALDVLKERGFMDSY